MGGAGSAGSAAARAPRGIHRRATKLSNGAGREQAPEGRNTTPELLYPYQTIRDGAASHMPVVQTIPDWQPGVYRPGMVRKRGHTYDAHISAMWRQRFIRLCRVQQ
jgi:hypothetical protein